MWYLSMLRYASLCSNPAKKYINHEVLINHNSLELQALILLPNFER